jgi:RNA polymerase sigma-70 factor (ECF subfamily)
MKTATELAKRLQQGNPEALFSLVSTFYNQLFRYGIRFTADKDLTKDLISQFFLHVWDHREQLAKAEHVEAYLMVSFRNFLLNYHRKISRQLDLSESELVEYSYEDYIIAWQDKEAVRGMLLQAMQSLSTRQRELIQLRYYEQLSCEEIAGRTGLSLRTIYNKLHQALKKLRTHSLVESLRKRQ